MPWLGNKQDGKTWPGHRPGHFLSGWGVGGWYRRVCGTRDNRSAFWTVDDRPPDSLRRGQTSH